MKSKKAALSCTLIVLFWHLLSGIGNADGECPDGIISYWKLNETSVNVFEDSISADGSTDGACTPSCPTSSSGVFNGGQSFDGNNDGVEIAAAEAYNWSASDSFSIELWVRKPTGFLSSTQVMFGRMDSGSLLKWYIGINSSGHAQAMLIARDGSGPSQPLAGAKEMRNANTVWHHIVMVRDAANNRNLLYVDGEEEAAANGVSYTDGFDSATAPLTMGRLDDGESDPFSGLLDEVAVYGRALTADEVKMHYYTPRGYCEYYDSAIKIMPLGDSITKGVWTLGLPAPALQVAYRLKLWQLLNHADNLMWSDFVGSEENGSGVSNFDFHHAGFGGIEDQQLASLLHDGFNPHTGTQVTNGPYLNFYPADYVLLHIGTNNIEPQNEEDVAAILDEIDEFSRNVTVLLARIISLGPDGNDPDTATFNANLQSMADSRIANGDKIIVVDMEHISGFSYAFDTGQPPTSGDMYETLHPNSSGYDKIGVEWFDTLKTMLPKSQAPVIVSDAVTVATKNRVYQYPVAATGLPSPAYSLITKPSGMTIDAETGLIEWTPTAIVTVDVSVRAENWADEDVQSYTIAVNTAPVAVADAYGPIVEGETLIVTAQDGLLVNDTDEELEDVQNFSASVVRAPYFGTVELNPDGSFTYTNDGSESTSDSFTYKVSDGKSDSDPATVTISVTLTNDAPAITGQQSISILEETSYTITLEDVEIVDADNTVPDDITLSVAQSEGEDYSSDGNTIYPNSDFSGTLYIPIQASDGSAVGDVYDLEIIVVNINDGPVITGQKEVSTPKDTTVTISLTDIIVSDPDNTFPDDFTLVLKEGANFELNGSSVTPASGFSGTLTVPMIVSDGEVESDEYDFSISVGRKSGGGGGGGGGGCFIGALSF